MTENSLESHDANAKQTNLAANVSGDVLLMKKRRQCSLEWEFIATILDRLFLFVFILTVLLVTTGYSHQLAFGLEG